MFDRLDREIAVVHGEMAALRDRLAAAQERLTHLEVSRATLLTLVRAVGMSGPCGPASRLHARERRRGPLYRLLGVRGLLFPRDRE